MRTTIKSDWQPNQFLPVLYILFESKGNACISARWQEGNSLTIRKCPQACSHLLEGISLQGSLDDRNWQNLGQKNGILGINNPLNKLLEGLSPGKGYLVKGSKQSRLATEIAFWVIKIIPQLVYHSHRKHHNFRHNPLLPLHATFNLNIYIYNICLAFRLISVLFFPSPQFLPFSFTAQAKHAVASYLLLPEPRCHTAE